jgi:cell division GTPase FtsZ
VSILLLSVGGGGGNILRSLKALFRRDLAVAHKTDVRHAERLRRAVTARFLDTNAFSLSNLPREERVLIGAQTTGQLGSRHNPEVARQALEESRAEVEALLRPHSVVILIGTGGKGTGAGTMFPIAQMAREQKKLLIPIFVRPSFERHEVDKRRFDHALGVVRQFDAAQIRLIEIANDDGYVDSNPEPQSVVWERMNTPIARGLRGLLYVLSDLSQVDPSDLSALFSGSGRLRIGFSEIDPSPSREPTDRQVDDAVRECWQNRYYTFTKPVGTSLVCIQGDWSNIVDARIKGGLAAMASAGMSDNPYVPLYARATHAPKPWGITALFAEYTGTHAPLEIDWTQERRLGSPWSAFDARPPVENADDAEAEPEDAVPANAPAATLAPPTPVPVPPIEPAPAAPAPGPAAPPFGSLWEFALAVNRGNPAALAVASDQVACDVPISGGEVRKLLGTVWFRGVVALLSPRWRDRILDALLSSVAIPDHHLKLDRRDVRLSELSYAQIKDVFSRNYVADAVRPDLDLLLTVARVWGAEALDRFEFAGAPADSERSRLASVLMALRK